MPLSHFALIACQRSGTQLLCEVVNSNPCLALWGEPFSRYPHPAHWPYYMQTLAAEKYPPAYPSDAFELLDEYMRAMERQVAIVAPWCDAAKPELQTLGIDLKYNQLRCISTLYSDLNAQPVLLEFLVSRGFRIVQLVRNPLHVAISVIVANTRKLWHNERPCDFQGRYRLPPEQLLGHLKWIRNEREEFQRLSRGVPVQTITYEDMVADLRRVEQGSELPPDTAVFSRLAESLDAPNKFVFRGKMSKVINKPYTEVLENYDELVAAIRDSEFCELASTI